MSKMERIEIFITLLFLLFHLSLATRLVSPISLHEVDENLINLTRKGYSILPDSPRFVEKRFKFPGFNHVDEKFQEDLGHFVGSFKLPHAYDARMFYFFFESRNKKEEDPVIIWFNGGPGCTSSTALFFENGPFTISDNLTLYWNDYGWDQVSNIMFVDQPIGTGFSYTNDERDIRRRDEEVITDLYDFLQAFFDEHPQFLKNELYLAGQSYAGHYNSELAARITKGNKDKQGIHINIKGFAIGNGLVNPEIQFKSYPDYALANGMIERSDYLRINRVLPACEMAIQQCDPVETLSCSPSYEFCINTIFYGVMNIAENVNYHDIRKRCVHGILCYDYSKMVRFLNQDIVKSAIGVEGLNFEICNITLDDAMLVDRMRNVAPIIQDLLEDGMKVLVYAGEHDFFQNWLGTWRWVHGMEWSGQKFFITATNAPFVVDGAEAGSFKSYGPLSFLKVYDSGNMVPMDQPKVALEMIKRWIQGTLPLTTTSY